MSQTVKTSSGREVKVPQKLKEFLLAAEKGKVSSTRKSAVTQMQDLQKKLEDKTVTRDEISPLYTEASKTIVELHELEEEEVNGLKQEDREFYTQYYEDESKIILDVSQSVKDFLAQDTTKPKKDASELERRLIAAEEKSKRLEIQARIERLQLEAKLKTEQRKYEMLQEEKAQREEVLKMEQELTLSKEREKWSNAHPSTPALAPAPLNQDPKKPDFESTRTDENPPSTPKGPTPAHDESVLEYALNRLAAAMENSHQRQVVHIKPAIFAGDAITYSHWRKTFEELIETDVKQERRLIYLLEYTKGEARECIENMEHLDDDDAYDRAMKLLHSRYGGAFQTYQAFKTKLRAWPFLRDGDGVALRKYADFLTTCRNAMKRVNYLQILDDPEENDRMVRCLPKRLVDRWSVKVDDWSCRNGGLEEPDRFPPFTVFVDYLNREARIECGAVKKAMKQRMEGPRRNDRTVRTNQTELYEASDQYPDHREEVFCNYTQSDNAKIECMKCQGNHDIINCTVFAKVPVKQRNQFASFKQLCKSCLGTGHFARGCPKANRCSDCGGPHHVLFHDPDYQPRPRFRGPKRNEADNKKEGGPRPQSRVMATRGGNEEGDASLVLPLYVRKKGTNDEGKLIYAVLDVQSDSCFMTETTAKAIRIEGTPVTLDLRTMAGKNSVQAQKVVDVEIIGENYGRAITVDRAYLTNDIAASHDQIPVPSMVAKWKHLRSIATQLAPVRKGVEIGMLLGRDCMSALSQKSCISGQADEPYAVETGLGWGVVGPIGDPTGREKKCSWVCTTGVKEIEPGQIVKMFAIDFQQSNVDGKVSQEDKRFLRQLEEGLRIEKDGHISLPLPLKDDVNMPYCKVAVAKQLYRLKGRFRKDPEYKRQYVEFMDKLIMKGHAEKVTNEKGKPGRVWHITHHGVKHPRKPGKTRVVKNVSHEQQGDNLNKHLLQGPDMINNMVGVMTRFREKPVGLTCDIESMFYQVKVNEEDRDLLRFLWFPDGDVEREPEEYRMTVHPFGATSSPGVVNFALKRVAEVHGDKHGEKAKEFVKDYFYVDDGVGGASDVKQTVELATTSRALCLEGRFNLTKYISNKREVLKRLPIDMLSPEAKEVVQDLTKILPKIHVLGTLWDLERDVLTFEIEVKFHHNTRRGLLSGVSEVYDPLGIISPFVLKGKQLLQQTCGEKLPWDAPLEEGVKKQWIEWQSQIKDLAAIELRRCYLRDEDAIPQVVQLHHFADASMTGYGECSYLRIIDQKERVHVSLVMAKARVAPLKAVTIPRMELVAATVAIKIARFLDQELRYQNIQHHFWTDSKVVLGYIQNQSKRFHIFVANRVETIREFSTPEQWRHVETAINPADIASRGCTAKELIELPAWLQGPRFLHEKVLPTPEEVPPVQENDPEVKLIRVNAAKIKIKETYDMWIKKFAKFSSWYRLRVAIAVLQRVARTTKQPTRKTRQKKKLQYRPVEMDELLVAERFILMAMQQNSFSEELEAIESEDNRGTKRGRMKKLNPFIDADGLIRVGGRLERSQLPYSEKHPIIIDQHSHVASILIAYHHTKVAHSGRESTHNSLRTHGYWILAPRATISRCIWRCARCTRYRGVPSSQRMADLPDDRMKQEPPFTYTGVDFFGPLQVRQGRALIKRYIALFTDLSSRASHLEMVSDLSTDGFINAYRRFVARRGYVKQLRCDRGTNFVGARKELEDKLAHLNEDAIESKLKEQGCDYVRFKMNVPRSSHMGGVWERQIRSARSILTALIQESGCRLDEELLRTLLAEVEAIMNSRPLTAVDNHDGTALTPISPYMILTLKPKVPPPVVTQRKETAEKYVKQRWRLVQQLAEEFWTRWRAELLPLWQSRQKWQQRKPNLKIDDVVILADEALPRLQWPLARILQTYPSKDGLVRSVRIKTATGEYDRPIHKLIKLEVHSQSREP